MFQRFSFVLLLMSLNVNANADDGVFKSRIPLFQDVTPLRVQMSGPFADIEKEESGSFSYSLGGQIRRFGVKFSPRGHYRRQLCDTFPPIKIAFDPVSFAGTIFQGADPEFKFVTQCKSPYDAEYAEHVLMEYTFYRILNAAGLPSYLVRQIDGEFKDSSESIVVTSGPGYLLESTKDLITRRGYTKDEVAIPDKAVTQLLVSHLITQNMDYDLPTEQNAKAVKNRKGEIVAYIPYDFDNSYLIVGENYFKNVGVDWDDFNRLDDLVRPYPDDLKETLNLILRHESQIRQEVSAAPLQPVDRQKFSDRMTSFFAAAKRILPLIP